MNSRFRADLMRIAIGQLWQETNAFNRNLTTLADFQNWGVATGTEVLNKFGETGELAGFVCGSGEWKSQPELVGLARFLCWPGGRMNRRTWQEVLATVLDCLDQAGKVDGVLMSLHGALA